MNSSLSEIGDSKPYKIMSIELEPTHYKADLWNTIAESDLVDASVIYTQRKNWLPDGGHNYLKFPDHNYKHITLSGRGLFGALSSAFRVASSIVKDKPNAVLVCGYSQIQSFFALMTCLCLRKQFFLFVDEFNTAPPPGKLSFLKKLIREPLRKLCFKFSSAVLVCGKRGLESAEKAGCLVAKIHDFPYTIDVNRILKDEPDQIPEQCLADLQSSEKVMFFSGRMIARKGLQTLLAALSNLKEDPDWVLWVEGDGPEFEVYKAQASQLGIDDRCRFLGFCQYDLHSWLIRSTSIVVIPSLEDNWGIVVDEGLQLGKPVISSDATGSCYDRITNNVNGFVFPAGDERALLSLLQKLLGNVEAMNLIGAVSRNTAYIRPAENLNKLVNLMRKNAV